MQKALFLVVSAVLLSTGANDQLSALVKSRELAASEIRQRHYQRAQQIYEELIRELTEDARYPNELALSLAGLANVYSETAQLDKAESCLKQAEQIFRKLPNREVELAVVLESLAGIYRFK